MAGVKTNTSNGGVRIIRHKGKKPKYLPKIKEKGEKVYACIHNCKKCQYGFEEMGGLYWCSLKQCRVDVHGNRVKRIEEVEAMR